MRVVTTTGGMHPRPTLLSRARTTVGVATVVVASLSLAACSPGSSTPESTTDPSAAASCEGTKVALASTSPAGDKSVVDDMINNGLEKAGSELGADTKFVEALDPANYESTLTSLASAGYTVIATNFQGMSAPLAEVAPQFPDVKFIQIYGDPVDPPISNLSVTTYRYDEGTYLSGIFAAKVTKTKIVGYEAGIASLPGIIADINSFKAGVESVDPDIQVIVGDVGSFTDDAKAKRVSASLFAQGADIVQGDGPVLGLVQAAKDAGQLAIIGAEGLAAQAPANVIGITDIFFGDSLYAQIQAACGPDFVAGTTSEGVSTGITGFHVYDGFADAADPALVEAAEAAAEAVKEAEAKIKSGELTVPYDTTPSE